jgi:hypothetical protein
MKKLALALLLIPALAFGAQPSPTVATQSPLTNNNTAASTAYADSAVSVEKARAQGVESTLLPLAGGAITGNLSVAGTFNNGLPVSEVQTDAALKAFPVTGLAAGYAVRDVGYYAAGDMPAVLYTLQNSACSLNSGAGDGGSQIASNTSGHCWLLNTQTEYDARVWGIKPDYNAGNHTGTDNTTALSYAISAMQSTTAEQTGAQLILPPGLILTGPQTITRPINIRGTMSQQSGLVLKTGQNSPLLTVSVAGTNYPGQGYPPQTVKLSNFRLTSVDGNGYNSTEGSAAGLSIPAQTVQTFVYGNDLTIFNMPGDGLLSPNMGSTGLGVFTNLFSFSNGGYGINLSESQIWTFNSPQVASNLKGGWLSNSDTQLTINNADIYTNTGDGIEIEGQEGVSIDGNSSIQDNAKAGVHVLNLSRGSQDTPTGYVVIHSQTVINLNSSSASNTYPSIELDGGSSGAVVQLYGAQLAAPYPANPVNPESYDFEFENSSAVQVFCDNCLFLAGGPTATGVTNTPAQLTVLGLPSSGGGWSVTGNTQITTATTFNGLMVSNGTNTVAAISGSTASNDSGLIQLYNSGNKNVQLSAGNGVTNYINPALTLGNGASNASPSTGTLQGTNGSGTNITGAQLTLVGGLATGNAASGDVVIQTGTVGSSGTTTESATTALDVKASTQTVIVSKALNVGSPAGGGEGTGTTNQASDLYLNGVKTLSATAPTISSGFGTGDVISNTNGAAAWTDTVGTSPGTTATFTMPAASTGWVCGAFDQTHGTIIVRQITGTTTSVGFGGFSSTTGAASAPPASDVIQIGPCVGH